MEGDHVAPERTCSRCGKRLSRLNNGPWCYACQASGGHEQPRRRSRRSRLPHDAIIALYRELGDSTKVARQLELPRSSVWYVVERAKREGLLPPGGGTAG